VAFSASSTSTRIGGNLNVKSTGLGNATSDNSSTMHTIPSNSENLKTAKAAASLDPVGKSNCLPMTKPSRNSLNAMVVNPKQRGNPILKHVTNVAWEYGDIVPDYQVGLTSCVLYLSLRYHNLNPEYIQSRLETLGNMYELRVLLVQVDIKDPHHALKELALMCILANCTLMVAWSPEEAGRYLETYKAYENKPPDAIMSRPDSDFGGRVADALTTVKGVNKTDAATLLSSFDTLANIVAASEEKLLVCPGLGPLKAKRLYDLFNTPFTNWK